MAEISDQAEDTLDVEEEGLIPIVQEAVKEMEKTPNTVDDLEEINLGDEENPRPTFISYSLPQEEKESKQLPFLDMLCMIPFSNNVILY